MRLLPVVSSLICGALIMSSGSLTAGDLFRRGGCGCGAGSGTVGHVVPVQAAPAYEAACGCSAAISACCGCGGGISPLGGLSMGYGYAGGLSVAGIPGHGSFLSGYEGLPNMDGGGIHHRYPYHSYRRPWAHPGTPSTNVTIVW